MNELNVDQNREKEHATQVKNLAEEFAKAAGQTTELIPMTIDAVNKGISIADATAANMTEVMGGVMEATEKNGSDDVKI